MATPTLEEARKLGYAPRGEECFNAGKLICHVTSAALYVVPVTANGGENGTEFVIVYAQSMDEARSMVKNEFGLTDEEVGCADDAIDVLDSQYNGMAILSTF